MATLNFRHHEGATLNSRHREVAKATVVIQDSIKMDCHAHCVSSQ